MDNNFLLIFQEWKIETQMQSALNCKKTMYQTPKWTLITTLQQVIINMKKQTKINGDKLKTQSVSKLFNELFFLL